MLKLENDEQLLKESRMKQIETRTLMVFGIPAKLRGEEELATYFDNLCVGK